MVRKVLFQYFSGLIFSAIGVLLFAGIYRILEMEKLDIEFGGDKANILFSLFLGLSIGGTFGIVLIEKFVYKVQGWNVLAMVLAIVFGFLGVYLGIVMLDKTGGRFVIFIFMPFFTALMCVLGYNIGMLFR